MQCGPRVLLRLRRRGRWPACSPGAGSCRSPTLNGCASRPPKPTWPRRWAEGARQAAQRRGDLVRLPPRGRLAIPHGFAWRLTGTGQFGMVLNSHSRQFGQQKRADYLSWVFTPLAGGVNTHDNECAISAPYASDMADVLGAEVTCAAADRAGDGVSRRAGQRRSGLLLAGATAGAGDRAGGRRDHEPKPDRDDHRRDVAERPDADL
jgi:hypothetical protein